MKLVKLLNQSNSPWYSAYWFSRMLINTDKYIPIGKEPKLLTRITSSLKLVADENKGKDILPLQKQILHNIVEERYQKRKSTAGRVQHLLSDLDIEMNHRAAELRGIRFFVRKICRWRGNFQYCAGITPALSNNNIPDDEYLHSYLRPYSDSITTSNIQYSK